MTYKQAINHALRLIGRNMTRFRLRCKLTAGGFIGHDMAVKVAHELIEETDNVR